MLGSRRLAAASAAALVLLLPGCGRETGPAAPVVVIGVDGAEWRIIEELWAEGRLPALKALAERGARSRTRPTTSESPVIWTTMATGVLPARHGITHFVVPTEGGDVPVSSAMRRVPAIWNMVSTAGRRVAVLGWWATWPAEAVQGTVLSDRVLKTGLEERFSPPGFAAELEEILAAVRSEERSGGWRAHDNPNAWEDRVMALAAKRLVGREPDLLLVYFRSVDTTSHRYWRYFRSKGFAPLGEEELAEHAWRVPEAYEAVDDAIAELVAAAPADTTFFVLSDHGFHRLPRERLKLLVDLDRVLERLGYLEREPEGERLDLERTCVYTYNSPAYVRHKMLRFAGDGSGACARGGGGRGDLRRRLERDLGGVRHENGLPMLRLRDPKPRERRGGADLVVEVLAAGAGEVASFEGVEIPGAILGLSRVSGSHSKDTLGVFLAVGPGIDPAARLDTIRSVDLTPTLLYAMGLPVAEDFDGRPRTELFADDFRRRHPLTTIASWGGAKPSAVRTSEADSELVEELRALGYLD